MEIPALIPVVTVDDIKKATSFYSRLGFEEEKEYTFTDDTGATAHAQLRKGSSILFLGRRGVSHYKGARADKIANATPSELGLGITFILQTDDLNSIFAFVQEQKLTILSEPADEWYGDKVFLFLDPFGYEWKVSQPAT